MKKDLDYWSEINEKVTWAEILKILNIGYKKARISSDISIICIFHKELSPSLKFSERRGIYHCFGCGFGGSKVAFVERFFRSRQRAKKFFKKHFEISYPFPEKAVRKKKVPFSIQVECELFECCNEEWMDFLEIWTEIEELLNEIYSDHNES